MTDDDDDGGGGGGGGDDDNDINVAQKGLFLHYLAGCFSSSRKIGADIGRRDQWRLHFAHLFVPYMIVCIISNTCPKLA